jgi:hypothetical protein
LFSWSKQNKTKFAFETSKTKRRRGLILERETIIQNYGEEEEDGDRIGTTSKKGHTIMYLIIKGSYQKVPK